MSSTAHTSIEDPIRANLIDEALALLSLIDSDQTDESTDEDPGAWKARQALRAQAGRIVAEMVAGLRGGAGAPLRRSFQAAA